MVPDSEDETEEELPRTRSRKTAKSKPFKIPEKPKGKNAAVAVRKQSAKKVKEPARGDGVPVTFNYSPGEVESAAVGDVNFNGYLGRNWYLRISRYDKGNKEQYICLRQFTETCAGKFGANLPIDMMEIFHKSVNDMYETYKKAAL